MRKRSDILLDIDCERAPIRFAAFCGLTISGSCHTQKMLEQMLRLIEEASRWDLAPKPASLWWTSTYDSEEKSDINLGTSSGCYKFPLKTSLRNRCAMNRQGKPHDAIEERMQSANKAFWKYILRIKSKDAPWKVKCQRLVHHVYMQSLRSEVKTGHGPHRQGKRKKRMGNQDNGTPFPIQ